MVELSKDHHFGLLFSWKMKEGLKKNIEFSRIKKYINFFWEGHLKEHFQEEETLLFNQMDDPLCEQGKAEHRLLADKLKKLNENVKDAEEITEFAALLINHIRFEERTLFPHLETVLPESVLSNVCEILTRQHAVPFKDDYPDEFWTHQDKLVQDGK